MNTQNNETMAETGPEDEEIALLKQYFPLCKSPQHGDLVLSVEEIVLLTLYFSLLQSENVAQAFGDLESACADSLRQLLTKLSALGEELADWVKPILDL